MDCLQVLHVDFDLLVVGVLYRVQEDELEFQVVLDFLVLQNLPDLVHHRASVLLADQVLLDSTHFKKNSFLDLFGNLT